MPEPAYANYMAFAISAGAKIRTIATTIEEGFSLPKVEKFEELINERTRAILICNPNNPTGYLYTRREMNQIRDLVKKYDLYLFSDEVRRSSCADLRECGSRDDRTSRPAGRTSGYRNGYRVLGYACATAWLHGNCQPGSPATGRSFRLPRPATPDATARRVSAYTRCSLSPR